MSRKPTLTDHSRANNTPSWTDRAGSVKELKLAHPQL
jgi:hypothetical protein